MNTEPIGRYGLFAGQTYYPDGGWQDFVGAFHSTQEAKDRFMSLDTVCSDWYQIVDLKNGIAIEWHGETMDDHEDKQPENPMTAEQEKDWRECMGL